MKLAIATMTLDKKGDPKLMEETLSFMAKHKYQVYVADGGSSEEFLAKLIKMNHQVDSAAGLTNQLKNAITRASENADVVLYTEPDKLKWVSEKLEGSIELYLQSGADFAAIARTPEVMATFPEFQQRTEQFMNQTIFGKTGIKGDFIYGPKIIPNRLGKQLSEIIEGNGWEPLMFLVSRAYIDGLSIGIIPTAVECPLEQRAEKNELYRLKQLCENHKGFLLGLEKHAN